MSGNSHGSSALFSAPSMNPRKSFPGEFARRAMKLALICATAALFAFWLASSGGRRGMTAANCEIHGRGGALCAAGAEQDRALAVEPRPERDCLSLGRGGLICFETARN